MRSGLPLPVRCPDGREGRDSPEKVEELEKRIEIDKQLLEDQIVASKGSGRLTSKGNSADAKRWSNHKWDFGKCEVGSDEFDKVLEDGYEVFTQADKLAYLRDRRWAARSSLS